MASRRAFLGWLSGTAAAGGLALYSEPVAAVVPGPVPVPPPGPEQTQFVIRNEGHDARVVSYVRSESITRTDSAGQRWLEHPIQRQTSTILLPGEELTITTHPLT